MHRFLLLSTLILFLSSCSKENETIDCSTKSNDLLILKTQLLGKFTWVKSVSNNSGVITVSTPQTEGRTEDIHFIGGKLIYNSNGVVIKQKYQLLTNQVGTNYIRRDGHTNWINATVPYICSDSLVLESPTNNGMVQSHYVRSR